MMRKPTPIEEYFFHQYHSPLMQAKLYREQMNDIAECAKEEKLGASLCEAHTFREHFRINHILWNYWDPIGVNPISTFDEYHSYVPELMEMKQSGAGKEAIAQKLLRLQSTSMGTPGTLEECREIAWLILAKGK